MVLQSLSSAPIIIIIYCELDGGCGGGGGRSDRISIHYSTQDVDDVIRTGGSHKRRSVGASYIVFSGVQKPHKIYCEFSILTSLHFDPCKERAIGINVQ